MAIEDSAVLAKLFGHLLSPDQVSSFLYAFPELRQERTKSMRASEMGNIHFMAMTNDAGAIQRDEHFKTRRDMKVSPLEDDSVDASAVWESIKETWCYDAEDEADNWWVGWGMLRLRSQQTELEFGIEVQVSAPRISPQEITPNSRSARIPQSLYKWPSCREIRFKLSLGLYMGPLFSYAYFLCLLSISAYTTPSPPPHVN